MITLWLLVAAVCPAPHIDNRTSTWVKADQAALERAKVGCREHYTERHCLKTFIKMGQQRYRAICKLQG